MLGWRRERERFLFQERCSYQPEVKKVDDYSTTDRARFEKMDEKERLEEVYKFEKPFPEVNVTPQVRQEGFEAFVTTDDHLMHLTGIARIKTVRNIISRRTLGEPSVILSEVT